MQVKTNAILSLKPTADHTEKDGHFVKHAGGEAALVSNAADVPIGVILDGETVDGRDSVAIAGGFAGTCLVKLSGNVAVFADLQLAADGSVVTDSGAGARVIVAKAMQAGTNGELIEAVIFKPIVIEA
jgi:hypothetical protein